MFLYKCALLVLNIILVVALPARDIGSGSQTSKHVGSEERSLNHEGIIIKALFAKSTNPYVLEDENAPRTKENIMTTEKRDQPWIMKQRLSKKGDPPRATDKDFDHMRPKQDKGLDQLSDEGDLPRASDKDLDHMTPKQLRHLLKHLRKDELSDLDSFCCVLG